MKKLRSPACSMWTKRKLITQFHATQRKYYFWPQYSDLTNCKMLNYLLKCLPYVRQPGTTESSTKMAKCSLILAILNPLEVGWGLLLKSPVGLSTSKLVEQYILQLSKYVHQRRVQTWYAVFLYLLSQYITLDGWITCYSWWCNIFYRNRSWLIVEQMASMAT